MHATLIDVSPGRPVPVEVFASSLSRAMRWGGSRAPRVDRFDAGDDFVGAPGLIDAYHRHVDGLVLHEARQTLGRDWCLKPHVLDEAARLDAFPVGAGGFPRDFEFIRTSIFEEKRQPLTAMQFFPADTSVPLGARSHTARRALGSGEAQIYRAGSEIPRARTTYAEETFGVAYVVCAVDVQFFDALTTDWAGLQQYSRDLRLAFRLVEERLNRIAWSGDVGSQLAGVLTYPHLAKQVIPVEFIDDSAPEDIAAAILDLLTTPQIESGGIFAPNALAVSPAIHAYIFSRKHSSSGGTDLTVGEYVLRAQAAGGNGVRRIDVAPELAGVGPNGEDGLLAYRTELDTVGHVMIQAPTPLPVFQASPLDQTTVVFAATGGMVMPDVGNAILGFAAVS
jgi:hypothetical protein